MLVNSSRKRFKQLSTVSQRNCRLFKSSINLNKLEPRLAIFGNLKGPIASKCAHQFRLISYLLTVLCNLSR